MADDKDSKVRVPPRWFVRTAWYIHRGLYRVSGGRFLRTAQPDKYGMMSVTTIGRRSGQERTVILAFLEDGPNLVTLAMNGWGAGEPAWWLNLQAHPEATVVLPSGQPERVVAHAATGDERARLWELWGKMDPDLDEYAALRPTETAVVVLQPNT